MVSIVLTKRTMQLAVRKRQDRVVQQLSISERIWDVRHGEINELFFISPTVLYFVRVQFVRSSIPASKRQGDETTFEY